MATRVFVDDYKIMRGATNCETALSGVSSLPASGSFIDVSGYDLVHVIMHLGTRLPASRS